MKTLRKLSCWMAVATLALASLPLRADETLKAGDDAPRFAGHDQDGKKWRLDRRLGKSVVFLYFYAKDDTARSSAEAGGLRDNLFELKQEGVEVVGVSFDKKASHQKFAFKYNLPFPLLDDTGGRIADAYGARTDHCGKLDRQVSFLIGLDGKIVHITDSPDPSVHLKELAAALAQLRSKTAL